MLFSPAAMGFQFNRDETNHANPFVQLREYEDVQYICRNGMYIRTCIWMYTCICTCDNRENADPIGDTDLTES